MIGDLVDGFIKALISNNGFLSYVGKALMFLAIIGPLSYCESQGAVMREEKEIALETARIDLQKACIEARGEWSKITSNCKFPD
jgi:hypothetical protein